MLLEILHTHRIILGETITIMGEVIVAVMVITVHHKVRHKHKIDKSVATIMGLEQVIGMTGVLLILAGYFIKHWI